MVNNNLYQHSNAMNMKKSLFLLTILLSTVLSAQEIKQTIVPGNEWVQYGKDGGQYHLLRREKIVFNDLEYFLEFYKIYCYRQDGEKVYRCSVSDGKEQLVLDYGLQVGDVFPLCEDFSLQVESISDTVITNLWQEGIQLKCLHLWYQSPDKSRGLQSNQSHVCNFWKLLLFL